MKGTLTIIGMFVGLLCGLPFGMFGVGIGVFLGILLGGAIGAGIDAFRQSGQQPAHPPTVPDIKKCPKCAETIKLEAALCRFCGHQFSEEEIAQFHSETLARANAQQKEARLRKAGICKLFGWILAIISSLLLVVIISCVYSSDPKSKMEPIWAIVGILLLVVPPGLGAWYLFKKARHL